MNVDHDFNLDDLDFDDLDFYDLVFEFTEDSSNDWEDR